MNMGEIGVDACLLYIALASSLPIFPRLHLNRPCEKQKVWNFANIVFCKGHCLNLKGLGGWVAEGL